MANVTDDQILLRVEAILASISQIKTVILTDDCPLTDAELPAVLVMIRQSQSTQDSFERWHTQLTVEIGALLTRLCGETVAEQRAQLLVALALKRVIPDVFTPLDRLALNQQPLAGIDQPSDMTDNGLETRPWGDQVMYATTYSFVISSTRR